MVIKNMPQILPISTNLEALQVIQFVRKKDYKFIKEMGRGACGITVLLHDEAINEYFVCKKYAPFNDNDKAELFSNFILEIKLLHQINHPNIVRVIQLSYL